jgi:hypothetical protein
LAVFSSSLGGIAILLWLSSIEICATVFSMEIEEEVARLLISNAWEVVIGKAGWN